MLPRSHGCLSCCRGGSIHNSRRLSDVSGSVSEHATTRMVSLFVELLWTPLHQCGQFCSEGSLPSRQRTPNTSCLLWTQTPFPNRRDSYAVLRRGICLLHSSTVFHYVTTSPALRPDSHNSTRLEICISQSTWVQSKQHWQR